MTYDTKIVWEDFSLFHRLRTHARTHIRIHTHTNTHYIFVMVINIIKK